MGEDLSSIKPGFPKAHPTSEKAREGCVCSGSKGSFLKREGERAFLLEWWGWAGRTGLWHF